MSEYYVPNEPTSEFQQRIHAWLTKTQPVNGMADRWLIAQHVFPDIWAKRAARGALIGHVDRACRALGLSRLPPRTQFDDATFCMSWLSVSGSEGTT